MTEVGLWHPTRGYWQAIEEPSEEYLAAYPEGTVRVPLMPHPYAVWNGKEWQRDTAAELAAAASDVRRRRDMLLSSEVDPLVTNPLRWAELTEEKRAEWTAYRRALLDVPQQAGFPHNVVWPTKPE